MGIRVHDAALWLGLDLDYGPQHSKMDGGGI